MGMRVLVVGKGGREHAIAWKLAQSEIVDHIIAAPGNPGMEAVAECVPVQPMELDNLVDLAQEQMIDLVVIGPEDPLAAGLADRLLEAGMAVAGPTAAAAQLEASKAFCKEVLAAANVPTGKAIRVTERDAGVEAIRQMANGGSVVVKADGLAAGKGVVVAQNEQEAIDALDSMLVGKSLGDAGATILIEEFLTGQEISVLCLTDGETIRPLAPACDYKRANDGDTGPNTGGMGAYTPTRAVTPEIMQQIQETILQPTIDEMRRRGTPMVGVLFAGLILSPDGPKVIEFNVRFGDPETQVVLPTLDADLGVLLNAVARGTLGSVQVGAQKGAGVCVSVASEGYPGSVLPGAEITGLDDPLPEGTLVFQAGTSRRYDGAVVTAGGRVLTVVGLGDSLSDARERAYAAVDRVGFDGAWHRNEIALREV